MMDSTFEVLRDLWAARRPDTAVSVPDPFQPETELVVAGSKNGEVNQRLNRGVPDVPTVPSYRGEAGDGQWEERAAILEFDAGLPRFEAERRAAELLENGFRAETER